MKQKNMLLVAVAVACGLVAAILTSQMSAKPAPVVIETVDVLVAAKDIPLNTKVTKDDVDSWVATKQYPKNVPLPPHVDLKAELVEKRATRAIKAGEMFSPTDLTNKPHVEIPPGYHMMSFNIAVDQIVGGFALPGSRVDILASIGVPRAGKTIVFPILVNMLILAVDANISGPQNNAGPDTIRQMSDVSMAVTKEQALILHAALTRGAAMRLLLRGQEETEYEKKYSREEVWAILNGDYDPHAKDEKTPIVAPTPEVVELPVPIVDLPAGTELTDDLIDSKFKMTKILPPAPANVIKNIREHTGRYLQKDLSASQFIPLSFLADSKPKPPEPLRAEAPTPKTGKPAPAGDSASEKSEPPAEVVKPVKPVKPPVFWDVTVQTTSGIKKYRYEVKDSGEYHFLGELPRDAQPAAAPVPVPKPKGDPDNNKTDPDERDRPISRRFAR